MNNESKTTTSLYVATNGNDTWSGKLPEPNAAGTDGPFATLRRAREAVRRLRDLPLTPSETEGGGGGVPDSDGNLPGPVTVQVRGGKYFLEETLVLGPEDSGTRECPVVYQACEGEIVRLLGGQFLEPTTFEQVRDPAVVNRLSHEARPHVLQCDLRRQGIDDFGTFASRGFGRPTTPAHLELFFDDQPMTVAQWPDAGHFARITGFTKPVPDEWGTESGDLGGGFTYAGDRPQRWAPSDDIWVHGYWAYDWANSYEHVRLLSAANGIVETDGGNYYFHRDQRFYFLNVLEELDQPGEFYVDRGRGMLYFWPPAPLEGAQILVSQLRQPLIVLSGASHVRLEGLTLEAGRGNGIEVEGGEGVALADCTIRNLGNWAVRIDGGANHSVSGCLVYGTGDGGVSVSGGDRQTLTPCNHCVVGNHIHHYARWSRCYVPGIIASGVGMRLANNLIHDAPHNAILFGGNDILIEGNEIHHVCVETGDAGAIYTGRDYTIRGNVIRCNFIHHMGGVGMGSIAIYMDDCVSGTVITENILWKCQYGIMLGGGRDFVVENNIFAECHPAIHADARGVDPNPVWQNMVKKKMRESLEAMRYHEPPYRDRYPEIAGVDSYYAAGTGVPPEYIRVERNLVYECPVWITECWPKGAANGITEVSNLVGAGHWFVDPDAGDFRLVPDAPAAALGFVPIPVEKIGIRKGASQ